MGFNKENLSNTTKPSEKLKAISNVKGEEEKVFNRRFYDSRGLILYRKIARVSFFVFVVSFFVAIFTKATYVNYKKGVPFDIINIFYQIKEFLYSQITKFLDNYFIYDDTKQFALVAIIPAVLTFVVILLKTRESARVQKALAGAGLSQFYLKKHRKKQHQMIFKLFAGQKMDYDSFKDKSGNLRQLLGVDAIEVERYKRDMILLRYSDSFPSINDLKDLKIAKFLKKDEIFLGVGLPKHGEVPTIKKKWVAKYLNFSDLPHSIAFFGSSGSGKSNTLNQFLQSIFFNFDKVQAFIFIDFKQGIEAQPYLNLEKSKKTGRIFVIDDSRLQLLNLLEKLLIIVKARGYYLRDKGLKKIKDKAIFVIVDELAEVLDYQPQDREERIIQDRIVAILETLLRIGRAAGVRIVMSTQSAVQQASGLTSGMKNNILLRISHSVASTAQAISIYEDWEAFALDPTAFEIGEFAAVNMTNSTVTHARALYVPDDFVNSLKLADYVEDEFDTEIKKYYEKVIKRMKNENKNDDDSLFDLNELLEELKSGQLVISADDYDFVEETKEEETKEEEHKENTSTSISAKSSIKAHIESHLKELENNGNQLIKAADLEEVETTLDDFESFDEKLEELEKEFTNNDEDLFKSL